MKLSDYECGNLYWLRYNNKLSKKIVMNSWIDENSKNFHIYPIEGDYKEESHINDFHQKIKKLIKEKDLNCDKIVFGKGIKQFATSKYIGLVIKEFIYMLCYETIYVDKENKINSIAGKIQYYKCRKNKSINECGKLGFTMMYPHSYLSSGKSKEQVDGHIVINTKFTIFDDENGILDDFIKFVKGAK